MTRTSGIILQILVIAIFGSSMFFFAMAVSHAQGARPADEPFIVWHFDPEGDEALCQLMPDSCGDEEDNL